MTVGVASRNSDEEPRGRGLAREIRKPDEGRGACRPAGNPRSRPADGRSHQVEGTDFRLQGEPGELLSEVEGACVADVPYGGADPGGVPEPGGVGRREPGDEV